MADICLILEGTYPYITGGVSSWVHNLIKALPHFRFALLTIMPGTPQYLEPRYELPENVVSVNTVYIHQYKLSARCKRRQARQGFEAVEKLYRGLPARDYSRFPDFYRQVMNPSTRIISPKKLSSSKWTWKLLLQLYEAMKISSSFIDFFWTWRFSHLPLLNLFDVPIPEAAVYHTVCTGYAGLLAVFAHLQTGRPFLLTEHGIYTNERRIEIEQANWIYDPNKSRAVINELSNPFKDFWTALFDHLSRLTYTYASEIITLYEANQKMELEGGAPPAKMKIIPNGIDVDRFGMTKLPGKEGDPFQVGFVGRVVPIKDVKTFIRACKIIVDKNQNVKFSIIGPTDEEPEYFKECKALVSLLGLDQHIEFTGRVNVTAYYPRMDVLVLTSISEAQPLVILEANCCGIPCVATEVGSCRELLYGRTPQDMQLGQSGYITPISNPEATAEGVLRLMRSEAAREQMGRSGIKRVRQFYDIRDLNFTYNKIYNKYRNQ